MTAQILVVDDEPDLEVLIQQMFRHQIREGIVKFLYACDGIEALTMLEINHDVDMVVTDINMPRMDGLSLLQRLQENEKKTIYRHRLGLWRHGQYSHCHEPRRIRFSD
jgi:adenylate cyclase